MFLGNVLGMVHLALKRSVSLTVIAATQIVRELINFQWAIQKWEFIRMC